MAPIEAGTYTGPLLEWWWWTKQIFLSLLGRESLTTFIKSTLIYKFDYLNIILPQKFKLINLGLFMYINYLFSLFFFSIWNTTLTCTLITNLSLTCESFSHWLNSPSHVSYFTNPKVLMRTRVVRIVNHQMQLFFKSTFYYS